MEYPLSITLPSDVSLAIDEFSRQQGISSEEFVRQAIKDQLFLRQFRTLRQRMMAKAQQQGIVSDQDVFDRVS